MTLSRSGNFERAPEADERCPGNLTNKRVQSSMDVTILSTAPAMENQENISRQRSAGKRQRDSFHKNVGSNSKRPALASMSNHVNTIAETQKQKTKAVRYMVQLITPELYSYSCSVLKVAHTPVHYPATSTHTLRAPAAVLPHTLLFHTSTPLVGRHELTSVYCMPPYVCHSRICQPHAGLLTLCPGLL